MKIKKSQKRCNDIARSLLELEKFFGRKPPDRNKTPLLAGKGADETDNALREQVSTGAAQAQDGGA